MHDDRNDGTEPLLNMAENSGPGGAFLNRLRKGADSARDAAKIAAGKMRESVEIARCAAAAAAQHQQQAAQHAPVATSEPREPPPPGPGSADLGEGRGSSEPSSPSDILGRLRVGASSARDVALKSAGRVRVGASSAADRLKESVASNTGVDVENLLPNRSVSTASLSIDGGGSSQRSQPQRERTAIQVAEEEMCALFPALSWKNRLMGCGICMAMGFILSFGSFMRFKDLLLGDPGEDLVGRWERAVDRLHAGYCGVGDCSCN